MNILCFILNHNGDILQSRRTEKVEGGYVQVDNLECSRCGHTTKWVFGPFAVETWDSLI